MVRDQTPCIASHTHHPLRRPARGVGRQPTACAFPCAAAWGRGTPSRMKCRRHRRPGAPDTLAGAGRPCRRRRMSRLSRQRVMTRSAGRNTLPRNSARASDSAWTCRSIVGTTTSTRDLRISRRSADTNRGLPGGGTTERTSAAECLRTKRSSLQPSRTSDGSAARRLRMRFSAPALPAPMTRAA